MSTMAAFSVTYVQATPTIYLYAVTFQFKKISAKFYLHFILWYLLQTLTTFRLYVFQICTENALNRLKMDKKSIYEEFHELEKPQLKDPSGGLALSILYPRTHTR